MPPEPYRFAIPTPQTAEPPSKEIAMPRKPVETAESQSAPVAAVVPAAPRTAARTATPTPSAQAPAEPPPDVKPDTPAPVEPGKPDQPGEPKPRKWTDADVSDFEARCAALAEQHPGDRVKLDRGRMPKVGEDLPDGATPALWCTVEPAEVGPRT
jgi:hypothetical protein